MEKYGLVTYPTVRYYSSRPVVALKSDVTGTYDSSTGLWILTPTPSDLYSDEDVEEGTVTEANITIAYSTTEWTNEDVVVTATLDEDLQEYVDAGTWTLQYTINSVDEDDWQDCTMTTDEDTDTTSASVTMETNGTIYFRLTNGTSSGDSATATVTNIDKIEPEVSVLRTFPERITFDGEDTESDDYGLSGIVGYIVTTSSTTPTEVDTWTDLTEATQYEFGDSITDGGYVTVREKETDLTDETTYYIWIIDEAGNISEAVSTTTLAYTAIDTDGDESSYIGYYADIDDDLPIEGVIYADLAYSVSSYWCPGSTSSTYISYGTYSYDAISSSSLREYYICDYNGDFTEDDVDFGENYVITSMPSTSGEMRFYALELDNHVANDDSTATSSSCFYWYYGGNSSVGGTYYPDYNTISSSSFGAGITNSATMKPLWEAETYGTKSLDSTYDDVWSIDDINTNIGDTDSVWYVPSSKELVAFADAFSIYSENTYSSFGLSYRFWSSTLRNLRSSLSNSFR